MSPTTRATLTLLALFNTAAAICIYPLTSMFIAAANLNTLSTWRELQTSDVITVNEDALNRYNNGQLAHGRASDWALIPEHLASAYRPWDLAKIPTLAFALNAIILSTLLIATWCQQTPSANATPAQEPPVPR